LKGAQDELPHVGFNLRPHGGEVGAALFVDGGDEAFEDHWLGSGFRVQGSGFRG
jgi:hypothetical protein